jgi:bifunctional UDP-N-acetylglucosamine pyrophosphorylase/glucosamine-1-phosphate N-acetyltransferase
MEKPGEGNEPSDLVNVVAHAHPSAALLLRALQRTAGETDDGSERALDSLFHTHVYHAVRYTNVWQAVKYPWHVIPLLPTLLSDIREPLIAADARIHPTAVIEGNVIIERGVNIFPHATVRGPCYIGKNTMIGNSALVWESSVGDHCVIGYGTEVKGSVLAGHVWTHSTYIGDSVIGKNVSFGAGSVAGNLRLDEGEIYSIADGKRIGTGLRKFGTAIGDDCRIGIHTSINPGIKVGRGSFLGTNVVATRDIPDGSFVSMKNGEMNVKKNISPPPEPNGREVFRRKAEQKHRIPA